MKIVIDHNPRRHIEGSSFTTTAGPGFVYHQSSQPFYQIKILLKNIEREPEMYFNGTKRFIYKTPRLVWFLNVADRSWQNAIMVHGAALQHPHSGDGIIVTAWADVGKSTNTLLLAQQGYKILGDDYVEVTSNGVLNKIQDTAKIYPHPDNLRYLKLSWRERLSAWFKLRFAKIAFLDPFFGPNLEVAHSRIGEISSEASLKRIYILEKGYATGIRTLDTTAALNKIRATSTRLWSLEGFAKNLVHQYCFVNNLSPNFVEERAKKILTDALLGKQTFLVTAQHPFEFNRLIMEHEQSYEPTVS